MIKRPTGRASCSNSPSPATAAAISPLSPRRRWRSRPPGRATSSALSSGASTPPRRPWRGRSRTSSPTPASTSAAGGSPLGIPARRGRGWSGCARATRATCGLRGQYAYEAQLLGAERQRRAEARAEAARLATDERKAAAAQTRAAERRAFEDYFLQALMKVRGEKLENWREKEKLKADKRAEDRELLGRKSSVWIADNELENRILKAIKFTTPL
ncbi:hypothetical protein DAI22_12g036100 [Oryza sativa Japonica Group]|nr:hypothetical protein DAI22_12g036100 [Oryza sativa Japonica Group]KAF2906663.1 hypothetical protein DAI22_12g036100 [Oryza sativa Japonica Group]KAF2906664.1 hypothetical protein DAI22_12g036100 [Oryza sativa Japonica Group]KAF2906665.1 hypothetical protein DAI22_12g036100 [Oryza sativa Japonica Group]